MTTQHNENLEAELEKLWNFSQAFETEQRFQALLTDVTNINARAEILTQIARAQGLQQKFEQAHQMLDEVEQLPKDQRIQVRYLLERGRVLNSSKQPEQARPFFLAAYELAVKIGADFYSIDAAHMMAIIEPLAHQLQWHEICLQRCEHSSDLRAQRWMGSITNNAAWTYHDLGQFERALEIFQKAVVWQEANGTPETRRIAQWSVARTLRSLGQFVQALEIQNTLLQEEQHDAYIHEELGECLLALGKPEKSKPHFAKAFELLRQDNWFVQNQADRLERLRTLAV